jgi:arsenite methyltransferase
MSDIREEVRARYAEAAVSATEGTQDAAAFEDCCGPGGCGSETIQFGAKLYGDLQPHEIPDTALLASLGCGNPTAVADLKEGETVLDLGSGGGIDVLLSAKRVGPTGKAYGLDMTDEMLELAEKNRAEAGAENVEFLKGFIEDVPLPDGTVDVIISNCVINLSSDKPAVFNEMHRVLRAGGRLGVSDVVADDDLTPEQRAERGSYVGCIAGALSFKEYENELTRSGFGQIAIEKTHEVADGMWSAIVKATKS